MTMEVRVNVQTQNLRSSVEKNFRYPINIEDLSIMNSRYW
jgi:hypothetical protein